MGFAVLVKAFFRWSETAKTCDRARAANALARAYLQSPLSEADRQSTYVAMTYLLDDPSPNVRLALADALMTSPKAPRAIMTALAEDQPVIASRVILSSPVLGDEDLVDLAGRGAPITRAVIAARPHLTVAVSAALAEIGEVAECLVLLENRTATISPFSLKRLAERHGRNNNIRGALLERGNLPPQARHRLVSHVAEALTASALIRASLGEARMSRIAREMGASAAALIATDVPYEDIPELVEEMRQNGLLTPALLMELLCLGKADFFAAAIEAISTVAGRRVRSILATGRPHAVRALMEAAGLERTITPLFVEAVLLWRQAVQEATGHEPAPITARLAARARALAPNEAIQKLIDLMAVWQRQQERREARSYASTLVMNAA
nr:DUF2336 domain-containing protein [Allorhizobium sonneratiae]